MHFFGRAISHNILISGYAFVHRFFVEFFRSRLSEFERNAFFNMNGKVELSGVFDTCDTHILLP